MITNRLPNKKAFERTYQALKSGNELTLEHIGDVYGQTFWIMIVYLMLDAQDAARAIQGAVSRLKQESIREVQEEQVD